MNLEELSNADMLHYKREQRKFFHTKYEQYNRRDPQTYERFLKQNYEKLKPIFDKEFAEQHRAEIEYLATVVPQ